MNFAEITELLQKKYGSNHNTADKISNAKRAIIPVSPAIDIALNGGLLTGTVSIFAGSYKTGKSTTALQVMRNAQKVYDFPCFYLDIEGRGGDRIFSQVQGLDRSKICLHKTTREKVLSAEDFLEYAEYVIETFPNAVVIMDSISRLYTASARDSDVSGTKRAPVAKLMSDFISRISGIVPAMNSTLMCIAQSYDNTSGYGPTKKISGGNAVQFQNDTSLIVKSRKDYTEGTGEKLNRLGNILEWDVENVPFGSVPTKPVTSYIRFGYGCDDIKEVIDLSAQIGLIRVSGAWHYLNDEKFQGAANLYNYLSEHEDSYNELWTSIKAACLDEDLLKNVCRTREEFLEANPVELEEVETKTKGDKKKGAKGKKTGEDDGDPE